MIEHSVWKFLRKTRAGAFLLCMLVPMAIVCRMVIEEQHTMAQRFLYVAGGAAIGLLAFAVLTVQDWLRRSIILRQTRQESVKSLIVAQLFIYLVVLPVLLFSVLLVVVILFF